MNYTQLESILRSAGPIFAGYTVLNATPRSIYDLGFDNNNNEFLTKFIELCGHEHSTITVLPWQECSSIEDFDLLKYLINLSDAENNDDVHFQDMVEELRSSFSSLKSAPCQYRKILIQESPSGFSWLAKKNAGIRIEQFIYFRENDDWILYSLCRFETDGKKDSTLVEKWDVRLSIQDQQDNLEENNKLNTYKKYKQNDENNEENNNEDTNIKKNINTISTVGMRVGIYLEEHSTSLTPFLRAKSARYCRNKFDKWKELMTQEINKPEKKLGLDELYEKYKEKWCKLRSYQQIIINNGKIIYEDGSSFPVNISYHNSKEFKLLAKYAESSFGGILKLDDNVIEWDNGSIWVYNGFNAFVGEYINENNELIKIINNGQIQWLNDDIKIIKGSLETKNIICYRLSNGEKIYGEFRNDYSCLEWSNGTFWKRKITLPDTINMLSVNYEKNKINENKINKNENENENENEIEIASIENKNEKNSIVDSNTNINTDTIINTDNNTNNNNHHTIFPDSPEISLTEQFENLEFDRAHSISRGEANNDWLLVMPEDHN